MVRNAYLADVMQRAGQEEKLDKVLRHSQRLRDRPAIASHPYNVVACALISELCGLAKTPDDLQTGRRQFLRALPHLLIQDGILNPEFILIDLQAQGAPQTRYQVFSLDGFIQEIGSA